MDAVSRGGADRGGARAVIQHGISAPLRRHGSEDIRGCRGRYPPHPQTLLSPDGAQRLQEGGRAGLGRADRQYLRAHACGARKGTVAARLAVHARRHHRGAADRPDGRPGDGPHLDREISARDGLVRAHASATGFPADVLSGLPDVRVSHAGSGRQGGHVMTRHQVVRNLRALGAAFLLTVLDTGVVATQVWAQGYPSRPITLIVPFAAGGPVDTTTRIVADKMKDSLGQPIIIENVGGAAGSLAAARVAKAPPDGYTIMTGIWGTHVANGAIYKLTYDVRTDFTPIALISENPLLIVASKKTPAANLKELIAWLKANPGKATQGTSGVGSVGHVAGLFFDKMTGTTHNYVPYRGLAPAMQDLTAGNVDLMFDTPATSLPQVQAGNIRAYAVTAKTHLPSAPDIPTTDEAGLPGLYASTWTALFAPKGTDAAVIRKLSDAVSKALDDPDVQKRLLQVGQDVYPPEQRSAEYLAKFQEEEIKKWWPIIKDAKINVD